jgi:hypothetical protein
MVSKLVFSSWFFPGTSVRQEEHKVCKFVALAATDLRTTGKTNYPSVTLQRRLAIWSIAMATNPVLCNMVPFTT